ncbi:MAG: hypothetical protein CBC05_02755 [Crocinitomicaceae bacterium TMED45]|nr:MAG: hypothetical protein CBC05_02755 [Crocinitomicaceae bacterium TMED45]|tara:strand:+ start:190 stop:678 length:489 start_codon:yes stop_codon:yes gene_type:complete
MKYAKSVIADKFWIVKDENINIATVEKRKDSFVVIENNVKVVFDSANEVEKHFKEDIFKNIPKNIEVTKVQSDIDGYPTKTKPFNVQWFDSIPTYTKTEKSQDRYCAGYYGVRFEGGTFLGNNPKLLTITEKCLDFVGPFKTEMEANINISTKKKQVKQGLV